MEKYNYEYDQSKAFTMVFIVERSLISVIVDSLEDLIQECEIREVEPHDVMVFRGKHNALGLKSSYVIMNLEYDNEEGDETSGECGCELKEVCDKCCGSFTDKWKPDPIIYKANTGEDDE